MRITRPGRVLVDKRQRHQSASTEILEGRTLLSTFTVLNTLNDGPGSLRAAIISANASVDADLINFNIPATDPTFFGGAFTILPFGLPLPAITSAVTLDGSSQTLFTGNTNPNGPEIAISGLGVIGDGLVLSSSGSTIKGIAVQRFSGNGIVIRGNSNFIRDSYLGVSNDGATAMGNGVPLGGAGVRIASGSANLIENNLISGNGGIGVQINSANNAVRGNRIGTDRTGTTAIPNGGGFGSFNAGVFIEGAAATGNTVGGVAAAQRNIISGNADAGVLIFAGQNNNVFGNYVGTDATGLQPLPNVGNGVHILNASNNNLGSAAAGAGNLISGNKRSGVLIYQGAGSISTGNKVLGNLVGVDRTGLTALPNHYNGVENVSVSGNTIGSAGVGRNIIAGNLNNGIQIVGGTTTNGTIVQGNLVGVSADVLGVYYAIPNGANGLELSGGASNHNIGGTLLGQGNVIGANAADGISIMGGGFDATSKNTIVGNFIGATPAGEPMGNGDNGIDIVGTQNTVGGGSSDAANVIANNGGDGVSIAGAVSTGNRIRINSIYGNEGPAINLKASAEPEGTITPNDPADADQGPNGLQNYPVITSITRDASSMTINGSLTSTPGTAFTVDIYATRAADTNNHGGAQTYLGSVSIQTDASGAVAFTLTTPMLPGLQHVTATAVKTATGDTSEFSHVMGILNLQGTSEDDATYIRLQGGNVQVFDGNSPVGAPTYSVNRAILTAVLAEPGLGNDAITIDFSGGNPLPESGFVYNANGSDSLRVIGTSAADRVVVENNRTVFNSIPITYANVGSVVADTGDGDDVMHFDAPALGNAIFHGRAGDDTLNVNSGTLRFDSNARSGNDNLTVNVNNHASIRFDASQNLAALNIADNAKVTLGASGDRVLRVGSLNLEGLLDLNDNGMILSAGSSAAVRKLLASGRGSTGGVASGRWNGNRGITSAAAAAAFASSGSEHRILLAGINSELLIPQNTFMGEAVGPDDLLVRFTRLGDVNFDGKVNDDDVSVASGFYNARYDPAVSGPRSGAQGDLNLDGKVDDDDMSIISGFYNPSADPLSET